MTTDLYHLDFFLVFIYLYLLETLIFWTKCFLATPYFKAFSLSPRGLPIPLFPTEDQRNLTHTSLSLGTKLSLARNLPRGCSLGPAQDAPGPCYIAPFCKKKKAHERALLWASWYRSCHFKKQGITHISVFCSIQSGQTANYSSCYKIYIYV